MVRENFQDLYLVLKERHKHLDSRKNKEGFNKVMDTKRHVWKVRLSFSARRSSGKLT